MDERQIIKLLSLIIDSLLESREERGSDKLAEEIAEASWDGLILLLRESMLQQGEMALEGFGHFKKVDDSWLFMPGAAIAEMEALRLQPEEGHRLLAKRAVSLLKEGLNILRAIPEDIEYLEDSDLSNFFAEESALAQIFGATAIIKGERLSSTITLLITLLSHTQSSLKNNSVSRSVPPSVPEVGRNYTGVVQRVEAYGAFVEILPGIDGLVHISELAPYRVREVEDVVKLGDEMEVKVISMDERGRIRLSRKAVIMEDPNYDAMEYEENTNFKVNDKKVFDR